MTTMPTANTSSRSVAEDRVQIATVGKAHGLQGEVKLYFTCEDITRYKTLEDEAGQARKMKYRGATTNPCIARIEGIGNRNEAEAARGMTLWLATDALPETTDDEFLYHELEGMRVMVEGHDALTGIVTSMQNYGGGDILEVQWDDSAKRKPKKELFAFSQQVVTDIDAESRTLTLALPEEL